jgi:hypothetical protein
MSAQAASHNVLTVTRIALRAGGTGGQNQKLPLPSWPGKPRQWAIQVAGACLIGVVLPVVLMDVLVGAFGANAMLVGLLYGVAGSMVGGTRRMVHVAPGIAVAAGLGAFTAYGWWWVVVLAVAGAVAGGGMPVGVAAPAAHAAFCCHVR